MTVVVVDISVKARAKRNVRGNPDRMLSLPEYLELSRRMIAHFARGYVRKEMLNNEDAIAFVAEKLMVGTTRFDESKGRTFRSYMNQCGIWAIQVWISNKKAANVNAIYSLDKVIKSGEDSFHDIIGDKDSISPVDNLSNDEEINKILNHESLTDIQRECLRLKFIDNMSYREIGSTIGRSFQRAEQIIKEALSILREELEV